MSRSFINGHDQPGEVRASKGRFSSGHALGILVVDCYSPFVPGNVSNASTFHFPVIYELVEGVIWEQLASGDPRALEAIIQAGKRLVKRGVRAVAGACGSFVNFQAAVAATLEVPVFLSAMLQAPLILQSLGPNQKLGVVAAAKSVITEKVFRECGITDPSRLFIIGAEGLPEMQNILHDTGRLDSRKFEAELVDLVSETTTGRPEIGALILQCSDMPPYAWAIQRKTGLPVFDGVSLINWVYDAVLRRPFDGFM